MLKDLAAETSVRVDVSGNNAAVLAAVSGRLAATGVLVAKQHDLLWRSADVPLGTLSLPTQPPQRTLPVSHPSQKEAYFQGLPGRGVVEVMSAILVAQRW
ncbi:hypothetical protein ACFVVB_19875 [Streptomyces californicus]|uniref:hypothetical protein n=1 Tax=Streptomyces californicus TaxID=67351 RepID=UPI0036DCE8F7